MKLAARFGWISVLAWFFAIPAGADVIFPARLDITETDPGRYDISFTLPIMENRVLRATPVMPPSCRDVTERNRTASYGGVTTSWSAVCDPASLAGEAILVEGLLGTQIELAFNLATLDGRVFNEILKPSRPGFLVPEPPSPWELADDAGVAGLRWVLGRPVLWMLALVVGLVGGRARELAWGVAAFALGASVAQFLVDRGWLVVSLSVAESLVLLTAAVPAVALAGGGARWRGWIRPLWPTALLIGVLTAGAAGKVVPVEGLSRGEQSAALALFAAGAAAGLGWLLVIAVELRAVLAGVGSEHRRAGAVRLAGYALGVAVTGMLLARVAGLTLLAGELPLRAFSPLVAAVALAPLVTVAGAAGRWSAPAFAVLAGVGLVPGLTRLPLQVGEPVVPALLLAVGMSLLLMRSVARTWVTVIAALTVVAASWTGTVALTDNVSRSTGLAVAMVVVATMLFYVALELLRPQRLETSALPVKLIGLVVVVVACVDRVAAAWVWFERDAATSAALGVLRIPVLALALVGLAVLLRPRRRRVLDELGIGRRRRPVAHWAVLAAALLAVPYATVAVPNPLHGPRAPHGDDARRLVSSVLFDTYTAFNLRDEEEVFDRLADSVAGDLVEDLYLDSRRRLNAGTRQGTEVVVREVSVVDIGEPTQDGTGSGDVAYRCSWVVTSRVRHLQHIHHRKNIYGGVLTLTPGDGRWKIADVELTSEDRVVLSGTAS